jgi:hypothetical protein
MAILCMEPTASVRFPAGRLALFLVASAALHAALLFALRSSPVEQVWPVTPLQVRLTAPAERRSEAPMRLPAPREPIAASRVSSTPADRAAVAKAPQVAAPPAGNPSSSGDAHSLRPVPAVSLDALLDSARAIARDDARRHRMPRPEDSDDNDRPLLPQLARALRREPPGETRFSDGMIKVVTASGSIYCLRPKPEFARGGPVDALSIPTNCP